MWNTDIFRQKKQKKCLFLNVRHQEGTSDVVGPLFYILQIWWLTRLTLWVTHLRLAPLLAVMLLRLLCANEQKLPGITSLKLIRRWACSHLLPPVWRRWIILFFLACVFFATSARLMEGVGKKNKMGMWILLSRTILAEKMACGCVYPSPPPLTSRSVRTLCDHAGTGSQLTFCKGEELLVLGGVDGDWIRCRQGDREGLVPIGYTSLIMWLLHFINK